MIGQNVKNTGLSRRNFLQWAGALSVTAATYGCSSGDANDYVVSARDNITFDKEAEVLGCGHSSHCISFCMLKLHVKNGKLLKISSGGDIPVEQEKANAAKLINPNGTIEERLGINPGVWTQGDAADESMGPIQRRPCMKGLSETKVVYAPDRLKYPLEQTIARGRLDGFKRIKWEDAYEKIKAMYDDMEEYKTANNLDYLPIQDGAGIGRYRGHYTIGTFGSSSTGGVNDGYWAALGAYTAAAYSGLMDIFNSKFLLAWSTDFRNNRAGLPFYLHKAKDVNIPILDINVYNTDTAAATGWNPTPNDGVPPYINVNQGTDTALMSAMAYIILKNGWYDDEYLESFTWAWAPEGYPKKFTDTEILSDSSKSAANIATAMGALATGDFTETWQRTRASDAKTSANINPTRTPSHSEWPTTTYTLAPGDSFVEYLIGLESTWGGGTALTWDSVLHCWKDNTNTLAFPAEVDSPVYNAVLKHAERVCGVKAETIVAITKKYTSFVKTGDAASIIYTFAGATRSQNGMYFSWMVIALQAMCGYLNKRGGGSGNLLQPDTDTLGIGSTSIPGAISPSMPSGTGTFPVLLWSYSDMILSGHDYRTLSEMRDDTLRLTSNRVDLGTAGATMKMFYRASGHSSPLQQQPDLTKNMKVFKDKNHLKHIVVHEMFMSPMAAIADIVLPVGHYFERTSFGQSNLPDRMMTGGQGKIKALYDTKSDQQILDELLTYCGFEKVSNPDNIPEDELLATQWDGANIPAAFTAAISSHPNAPTEIPSYETMKKEANVQLVMPLDKAGLKLTHESFAGGQYWSQTGYVQFMNPWMKARETDPNRPTGLPIRGGWRCGHMELDEGFERLMQWTVDDFGQSVMPEGVPGTGMPGLKLKDPAGSTSDINNRVRYPLELSTPHLIQRSHAHFDSIAVLKDLNPHVVRIHPSTAGKRGINDGDMVYVYNDNGCIKLPAMVTKRVKPHSIIIGQGAWYRASTTETYKAYYRIAAKGVEDPTFRQGSDYAGKDANCVGRGGTVEPWDVPVDVGGAINSLMLGRNAGTGTPLIGNSTALPTAGMLCEVSKTHPDKI